MLCMREENNGKSGSGYEALEKCETENGARTLQQASVSLDYPYLRAQIREREWQTILARECFYHATEKSAKNELKNQSYQAMLK